jgi:hypothetical protein
MNMPGFTAEGSLYKSRGCYMGRNSFATLAGSGVTPQLPIGFCMAECDDQYDWGTVENGACKFGCMGGDGGAAEAEVVVEAAAPMIASYASGVVPGSRRRWGSLSR